MPSLVPPKQDPGPILASGPAAITAALEGASRRGAALRARLVHRSFSRVRIRSSRGAPPIAPARLSPQICFEL
jgi:hypothetical protein